MSLILISRSDIVLGKSLSWPLYDQDNNVLIERGGIVRDKEHMDDLLAQGAYRELSLDNFVASEREFPAANSSINPATETAQFTFDDMKLKVESRLQLEPSAQLGRESYFVKVIGFLRGASLLVTTPTSAKGEKPELKEGLKVTMRSFSGQNAFGFSCTLKRIVKLPYEYLHLSFPDIIKGIMIRKAIRIKTRIIVAVQNCNSASGHSALISNISADGAALDSRHFLGNKEEVLNLSFRVNLHKIDAYLSIKGMIRAVLSEAVTDISGPEVYRYGIEFKDLQPNDMVILQSMIYQNMIENPQYMM